MDMFYIRISVCLYRLAVLILKL